MSVVGRHRQRGWSAFARDGDRADYLDTVSRLLWPAPARVSLIRSGRDRNVGGSVNNGDGGRSASDRRELVVLPSRTVPRLLVPAERRPAAAAVELHSGSGPRLSRLGKRTLSLAMSVNMAPRLFRDRLRIEAPPGAPTIDSYLSAALGRELRISLQVTTARANRKPIMHLLTPGGDAVGFVKLGTDPLTRRLVRAERDALVRVANASPRSFKVPGVLHHGVWNGLEILVMAPLPARLRRPVPSVWLGEAMREVAGIAGIARERLAGAAHWQRLRERLSGAPEGRDRAAAESALGGIGEQGGDVVLSYGSWHGDFSPWNMATAGGTLWIWDWERFAVGAPLGFDALHHWLQTQIRARKREPAAAASELVSRAPALLEPFGVGRAEAWYTVLLYLAELAARNLADRQEDAGAQLGNPGWWLIPAITQELAR